MLCVRASVHAAQQGVGRFGKTTRHRTSARRYECSAGYTAPGCTTAPPRQVLLPTTLRPGCEDGVQRATTAIANGGAGAAHRATPMTEAARRLGAPLLWTPTDEEVGDAVVRALEVNENDNTITSEHVTTCVAFYEALRKWLLYQRVRVKALRVSTDGVAVNDVRTRISVVEGGIRTRRIVGPHRASLFHCTVFVWPSQLDEVAWPTLAGLWPHKHGADSTGRPFGHTCAVRWETADDVLSVGRPRIA